MSMQQDPDTDIFVAPLHIRKSGDTKHHRQYAAPPIESSAQARFHNYLRAAYPFQPTASPSPTTVTLPLSSGDIILIHSIHTNGWADGTLLETGERGWLPTNYCEAYEYAAMRPLLRALTEFWDIMRSSNTSSIAIFHNKDYMRGLVAGVRYLLEKCDCLTRDSPNVRKHDGMRRIRKGLLSDLSTLVKAGKHMQTLGPESEALMDACLDDLLLQAFKIVTRAVKFYDMWGEEIAFSRSLSGLDDFGADATRLASPSLVQHPDSTAAAKRRSQMFNGPQQTAKPSTRRSSTSHRLSYASRPEHSHLASNRLNQSYDAFLGVLASFLGSHMQSRSSSELLLTTQQAVKSCRGLLSVVELVIDRNPDLADILNESKDAMYDAITELVYSAKQVFLPLHSQDDELIYRPDENQKLVQAATNCVSGAGRCIARTRSALEDTGDFEIDPTLLERSSSDSSKQQSPIRSTFPSGVPVQGLQIAGLSTVTEVNQDLPWLNIPGEDQDRGDSPSTINDSVPPTPADDLPIGNLLPTTTSQTTLHSPVQLERPLSNEFAIPVGHLRHKSLIRSMKTTSQTTSEASNTTNDQSDISTASTAVSSFQCSSVEQTSSQESLVSAKMSAPEDEGEAVLLEKTYAHELMHNRDGQLVGGTLHALVEKLTAHDSTPDALFVSTVYLTFRLFAKPADFVAALVWRFRYAGDAERLAGPVRLRVYNALKGWLESHWRHDCDDSALPAIIAFAREDLKPVLPSACKRLLELANIVASTHAPAVPRVQSAMGKTSTSTSSYVNPAAPMPPPVISKSQLTALRTWKMGGAGVSILDFDPLEIARQITLKTSQLFCSILPEELLSEEWMKRSSSLAVNVRALSTLSTDISNLVSESILVLEDVKKRAAIIKQWVKISSKLEELKNFDSLFAIVAALDSTNIRRMQKTWEQVSQKTKNTLKDFLKLSSRERNSIAFRSFLSGQLPPCIPFLGMYLTDLTFVDHGNPATRQLNAPGGPIEVINLDKHMRTARLISDLQRFQIPYRFQEVSELQTWMQDRLIQVRSDGDRDFQKHYRRSLILEPRELMPNKPSPNPEGNSARDKFDLLAWTHIGALSKQKSAQQIVAAQ